MVPAISGRAMVTVAYLISTENTPWGGGRRAGNARHLGKPLGSLVFRACEACRRPRQEQEKQKIII
jgi:hypothetical protein